MASMRNAYVCVLFHRWKIFAIRDEQIDFEDKLEEIFPKFPLIIVWKMLEAVLQTLLI